MRPKNLVAKQVYQKILVLYLIGAAVKNLFLPVVKERKKKGVKRRTKEVNSRPLGTRISLCIFSSCKFSHLSHVLAFAQLTMYTEKMSETHIF